MARLTEAQVLEARRRYAAGERLSPLAQEYGVDRRTLRQAVVGETWAHLPGAVSPGCRRHPQTVLDEYGVAEARRRYAAGESSVTLARAHGVDPRTMAHAITGITWAHVPGAVPMRHRRHVLTDAEVLDARRRVRAGATIRDLAAGLGVRYRVLFDAVHGYSFAHVPDPVAVRATRTPMTDAEVLEARRRRRAGEGVGALARAFDVDDSTMSRALRGRLYAHVPEAIDD